VAAGVKAGSIDVVANGLINGGFALGNCLLL